MVNMKDTELCFNGVECRVRSKLMIEREKS